MKKPRLSNLAFLLLFIANSAFALCGDANFDSALTDKDLDRIKFLTAVDGGPHFMDYSTADVNSDGVIDSRDYMLVRRALRGKKVLKCPFIRKLVVDDSSAITATRISQLSFSHINAEPYLIKKTKTACFFNPYFDNVFNFYNDMEKKMYFHVQANIGKEVTTPAEVGYCYFKQNFSIPYDIIEAGYWSVKDEHFVFTLLTDVKVINE